MALPTVTFHLWLVKQTASENAQASSRLLKNAAREQLGKFKLAESRERVKKIAKFLERPASWETFEPINNKRLQEAAKSTSLLRGASRARSCLWGRTERSKGTNAWPESSKLNKPREIFADFCELHESSRKKTSLQTARYLALPTPIIASRYQHSRFWKSSKSIGARGWETNSFARSWRISTLRRLQTLTIAHSAILRSP